MILAVKDLTQFLMRICMTTVDNDGGGFSCLPSSLSFCFSPSLSLLPLARNQTCAMAIGILNLIFLNLLFLSLILLFFKMILFFETWFQVTQADLELPV